MTLTNETLTRKYASLLVALAAVLGLTLAGCSNSDQDSADQGSTSNSDDQAVKYTQCMRSHGITDFPDPVDGKIQLTVRKGTDLDPSSPKYQSAQNACKSLEPPGLNTGSGQSSSQQEAGVKFAACMRKNGVPNFPDPVNGRMKVSGGIDQNSQAFQKAVSACRDLAPAGIAGGGR